jgi:PAS domain S-box-containing protein
MADTKLRRALLDNAAAALFVTTPQRIIRLANQRAIDTFSEDGLALTGRSIRIIHPDDDSFDTFGGYYRTVRQDGGINIDYQQFIVGGELRWFAVRGSLLDPDNPEGDLIWTMVDTTERRRIEDALRSTRAHLFEVIQHFPGGVLAQNQNGDVVVANRVICDLLGVQTPPVALTGINREAFRKMISQDILDTFQESVVDGEYSLPDGRTIRINLIPLKNGDGQYWSPDDRQ